MTLNLKKKNFTIIIPTYNRQNKIKRHLDIFNLENWKKLINCKPNIIIADDFPGGKLKEMCEIYKSKLKFFNLIYISRQKNLGQGINLFKTIQEKVDDSYIWSVGDDDILIPDQSIDFINKILKYSPDVAVCEFRQGKDNEMGTFFEGKSRIVNEIDEGLELIQRFGKLTSLVFKKPKNRFIKVMENKIIGCMYEDRPLAVISYLTSNEPRLYLKTELTAKGDKDFGLLRYSMRVFTNLSKCMNLTIEYCSKLKKKKFPLIKNSNIFDEYKWWKIGIYSTMRGANIRYTRMRFIKEVFIFPFFSYHL